MNHELIPAGHTFPAISPPVIVRHSGSDGTNQDSESSSISLGLLWYVICRWSKIAIPLGILCAAVAVALVWYLFERQYRAEAWLQIRRHRPFIAVKMDEASDQFVETQIQLLQSRVVLAKVLAKPAIARIPELRQEEDPLNWIQKHLEVKALGRSELFTVAVKGPNPDNNQKLVDEIVQSYFTLQNTQSDEQTRKLLDALRREKESQVEKVKTLEEKLQELVKEYPADSTLMIGQNVIQLSPAFQALQQRLSETEVQRQLLEAQSSVYEKQEPIEEVAGSEIESAINQYPEVVSLNQRITKAKSDLLLVRAGSSARVEYERRISDYESQLKSLRQELRQQVAKLDSDHRMLLRREQLAQFKAGLQDYRLREKNLNSRIDEEKRKLDGQTGGRYRVEFVRSDLARAKEVADKIEDRIFALNIEYLSPQRPEQVVLIQAAEAQRTPIQVWPYKQLAIAVLGGLILPFAAFGAFEVLTRRVYQSKQILEQSNLALLGEIAVLPGRPLLSFGGTSRKYTRDRAIFEESVEALRTMLSVSNDWKDTQVLVVASAVSGEGKTSLASQLAAGWARNDPRPTLIIDGDVRAPDIHTLFGVNDGPGLSDVLVGKCSIDDAVVTWEDGLHILPAGNSSSHPHRLFAGSSFPELIEQLRTRYGHIVIDVAPILSASEVLQIVKQADGVLLCARKDHSRASQVRLAHNRLVQAGVARIGAVMSGLSSNSYAYHYGEYLA